MIPIARRTVSSILAIVFAVSLSGMLGSPASAVTSPVAEPTIQVTVTEIVPGTAFDVTLAGWPTGVVSVAICGERASAGSGDCAGEQAGVAIVGADGTGTATLVGAAPPVDCPCILRATTLTDRITATLPVVVHGVGSSAAPEPATGVVPVSRLVVASSATPLGSWFERTLAALGGPGSYRVAITVQNIGDLVAPARSVDVLVGRDSLGGEVATTFEVAPIAPGELQDYTVDVQVGAPLLGAYVVHGELDPADSGSVFSTEVVSWPIAPAAAVLYLGCWMLLRRVVRRAHRAGESVRVVPALRALAMTAIVCAAVFFGHWGLTSWLEDSHARQAQSGLLADFTDTTPRAPDGEQQSLRTPTATDLPATGDMVGVLRIPALDDLQLAIVEGITPEQLGRGPAHYPGTALPGERGNVVVAGHNARSGAGAPFVDLDEVRVGDTIAFDTAVGSWTYTVTAAHVVPPTQVSVLLPVRDDPNGRPTTSQLTLITCSYSDGGVTDRLVVEAEITDPEDASL